ncbi:MAG: DUF3179 domain-containing protein [Thaumarchaeota archaeon]|nr:DUF3179 domain-containing protein [Nitrososphaerota archaeon]
MSGGPPKDGIPPIDNPKYVSPNEVEGFLSNIDIVFGLHYNGVVRAYPQIILVWHEIVNDVIAGEKASITYCPLTGSAVGFRGKSTFDGQDLTFGTTGKLVNSNLLMYDRQSDSNWPQILGAAISGQDKGSVLDAVPLEFTTWERWRAKHPDTEVLSNDTGHYRAYGTDPYGSYPGKTGYYFSQDTFFPVMASDSRLGSKKVVVGIRAGDSYLAAPKEEFGTTKLDNVVVGREPIVLLYDEELDVVRAYSRNVEGRTLEFLTVEGKIIDSQTSSEWTSFGLSTEGSMAGVQLNRMNHFDVMWFAWYAFFPQTELYGRGAI